VSIWQQTFFHTLKHLDVRVADEVHTKTITSTSRTSSDHTDNHVIVLQPRMITQRWITLVKSWDPKFWRLPFGLTFTSYSGHYDDCPILIAPSNVHRHNIHKDSQSFTAFFYALRCYVNEESALFLITKFKLISCQLRYQNLTLKSKLHEKSIPMTFQQVTWVTIIIAVPNTNGTNNILCTTMGNII